MNLTSDCMSQHFLEGSCCGKNVPKWNPEKNTVLLYTGMKCWPDGDLSQRWRQAHIIHPHKMERQNSTRFPSYFHIQAAKYENNIYRAMNFPRYFYIHVYILMRHIVEIRWIFPDPHGSTTHHGNTVFCQINAPSAKAENEPLSLSDLNKTDNLWPPEYIKCWFWFRLVEYFLRQRQKSWTCSFKQARLFGKIQYFPCWHIIWPLARWFISDWYTVFTEDLEARTCCATVAHCSDYLNNQWW